MLKQIQTQKSSLFNYLTYVNHTLASQLQLQEKQAGIRKIVMDD